GALGLRLSCDQRCEELMSFAVRCISTRALIQTANQRAARPEQQTRAYAHPPKFHLVEADSPGQSPPAGARPSTLNQAPELRPSAPAAGFPPEARGRFVPNSRRARRAPPAPDIAPPPARAANSLRWRRRSASPS